VRNPVWFDQLSPALVELPEALRPLAPRWTPCLGYGDARRLSLIQAWLEAGDPSLHRAAVYALAQLDGPEALRRMRALAESTSPLARFARWQALGHDSELIRPARSSSAGVELTAEEQRAASDFVMLWQTCRRTPIKRRGDLIQALRDNAAHWRSNLGQYLQAPDPRDRLLALQVISTRELAQRYRKQLRNLMNDPIQGIAGVARHLLTTLGAAPQAAATPPAPIPNDNSEGSARARLNALLSDLSQGRADPADTATVEQLRRLLRQVYERRTSPVPLSEGAP
jgi:hypothetical protein